MIIELHVLQNFVPANLNRDDTGAPKDCLFGGFTRARISSQCFKRAMRVEFRASRLIAPEYMAERTSLAQEALAERLINKHGFEAEAARQAALMVMQSLGIKLDSQSPEKTSYLLFLAPAELDAVASIVADTREHFGAPNEVPAEGAPAANGKGKRKNEKAQLPPGVINAIKKSLDGGRAADLALFGRMIADTPEHNVEAACQVAHALSTHRVETEFDFFTAWDERSKEDATGAGMLGTLEYNSACFYRYANLDVTHLQRNLGGDTLLTRQGVAAFIQAMVHAVPSGKQNSMAAHNPPSLILAVARDRGQWNLANAFLDPIKAKAGNDLMRASVAALDDYWGKVSAMYGTQGMRGQWIATLEAPAVQVLRSSLVSSFAALQEHVLAAAFAEAPATLAGGR